MNIGLKSPSMYTCQACSDKYYVTAPQGDFGVARWCEKCRTRCDMCYGEGVIFESRSTGYQAVRNCPKCSNLERRMKLFNEAKLPARYHNKDFDSFSTYYDEAYSQKVGNLTSIHGEIYNYSVEFMPGNPGILLSGSVGTGKTHLMAAFVRHLALEKGFSCRFIEFTHLLSELREAYETRQNSIDIINRLSTVPVLFIDELGKGRKTDWELSIIDELISKRYNSCLSTFFTTNYPLHKESAPLDKVIDTHKMNLKAALVRETLVDRVGQRIVSRLFEMCRIMEIGKDVPDYRQRRMQQAHAAQRRLGGSLTKP